MTFEEKTISSEVIYEGKVLTLRKDKVETVNGEGYREIIEHGGGACMIALTKTGKMLMVRQYRKAAGRDVFEIPAGKIEKGEDPAVTAKRELKEETGYTARDVKFLTKFYPSVGYDEEVLYLYVCRDLVPGKTDFDDSEALEIEEWDVQTLYEMVMDGKIEDAKSIIAILMIHALFI
ncbi:MAG: NUDIX hydrolase [Clostridia bacterium]|nr:NUDIX hydrolase [Clostridia bacterium]